MLNIKKIVENKSAVITLEGRLDTITAPELDAALREVPDGVIGLILDFAKLDYISSAGLRVLLSAQKHVNARRGSVKLRHVSKPILEIFEVTGFADILTIEE